MAFPFQYVTIAGLVMLLILTCLLSQPALAQDDEAASSDTTRTVLRGRVTDAATEEPLPAVNIFLSNTTRGTTTDTTGRYALRLPPGSYELVVSMIGYETQHVNLEVGGQTRELQRDFQLVEKVIQQEEITVRAPENTTWWKRYRKFEEQFLGSSANAEMTTIENPYPINFEVTAGGTLVASCERPLTIINKALGYRITFHLREFAWNEPAGSLQYLGWSFFEALEPESEQQAEQWAKNRRRAYQGSLRHLMRAMIKGETEEEGFYIKPKAAAVHPLGFQALEAKQFISQADQPHLYQLSFEETLRVIYVRSETDGLAPLGTRHEERETSGLRLDEGTQVSWLRLDQPHAQVHKLGYLYDPRALVLTGALGQRRVADALPKSYVPR